MPGFGRRSVRARLRRKTSRRRRLERLLTDRLQLVHLCASNACTSAVGTFRIPAYWASINSIVAGVAATLCVFRELGHLGAASAEPARRNRPLLRDVLPGVTSALRVFEAGPLMLGYVMTQSALISRATMTIVVAVGVLPCACTFALPRMRRIDLLVPDEARFG